MAYDLNQLDDSIDQIILKSYLDQLASKGVDKTTGKVLRGALSLTAFANEFTTMMNQQYDALKSNKNLIEVLKRPIDKASSTKTQLNELLQRIAHAYYHAAVNTDKEALNKLPVDQQAKQLLEIIKKRHVSYYDTDAPGAIRSSIHNIVALDANTKTWKKAFIDSCNANNLTSNEARRGLFQALKEKYGTSTSDFNNPLEISNDSKGAVLNLTEALNNMKQFAPSVYDKLVETVEASLKTHNAKLDDMLLGAYNKVIAPLNQQQQKQQANLKQQQVKQANLKQQQVKPGEEKPETAEFNVDVQFKLYSYQEFFEMKSQKVEEYSEASIKEWANLSEEKQRLKAMRNLVGSVVIYSIAFLLNVVNESADFIEEGGAEEKPANEEYFEGMFAKITGFVGNLFEMAAFDKMPTSFKDLKTEDVEEMIQSAGSNQSEFKSILANLGFENLTDSLREDLFSEETFKEKDNQTEWENFLKETGKQSLDQDIASISQKTFEERLKIIYQPSKKWAKARERAEKIATIADKVKW